MVNIRRKLAQLTLISVLCLLSGVAASAEEFGIFELLSESSGTYDETLAAVADALAASSLTVHARHDVRVPEQKQQAHVFVLTSPAYRDLAKGESPRTVSAQVLRVAVYTWGEDQQTLVNMANPVPHAMVFYAKSDHYDALVAGARSAAEEIRAALAVVPGDAVSVQQSPQRSEKHYNKYKGDGPARMMAKFRTFKKSQLLMYASADSSVSDIGTTLRRALEEASALVTEEPEDWELIAQIPFGDSAIYLGISNPYIEDKMIRINSRFRSDGKTDDSPYPGVDHVAALPTDILIISEEGETKVLHYGQMWRMQLYFWDSGYRAFTANVGVPGAIANSIEDLIDDTFER